jgi:hypothetical protein
MKRRYEIVEENTVSFQKKLKQCEANLLTFAHKCNFDLDNSICYNGDRTLFELWASWSEKKKESDYTYDIFALLIATGATQGERNIFDTLDSNADCCYAYSQPVVNCLLTKPKLFPIVREFLLSCTLTNLDVIPNHSIHVTLRLIWSGNKQELCQTLICIQH